MVYDLRFVNFNEARKLNEYYFSGNNETPGIIANLFQSLATDKHEDKRSIVSLRYYDYTCELDIFWEEISYEDNDINLVIQMFLIKNKNTEDNSVPLLISNIYKENYLEKTMFQFILDYINQEKLNH